MKSLLTLALATLIFAAPSSAISAEADATEQTSVTKKEAKEQCKAEGLKGKAFKECVKEKTIKK